MGDHREKSEDVRRPACLAFLLVVLILMFIVWTLCGCTKPDGNSWIETGENTSGMASDSILLDEVPDWSGSPYVVINNNVPEFSRKEVKRARTKIRKGRKYEHFSELDRLGRCGTASAAVSRSTIPEGERGSIGMIQPSGWQIDKYGFIDNGGYLYNRCHLLAWQLTGQNDEERNLITGTRYLNVEGMLPFENEVAEYIKTSGAHVLYRATPVFHGKELVARGVQLEAYSLEDDGAGLSFNVYCYNVQPGVKIRYKTGKNRLDRETLPEGADTGASGNDESGSSTDGSSKDDNDASGSTEYPPLDVPDGVTYILNKNTMRFHRTDCDGARTIREHNREWFYGTRKEAVEAGYIPCGMCKP